MLQGTLGIPGEFGFLKKNELFVGRVAMLGFAAELVGEVRPASCCRQGVLSTCCICSCWGGKVRGEGCACCQGLTRMVCGCRC